MIKEKYEFSAQLCDEAASMLEEAVLCDKEESEIMIPKEQRRALLRIARLLLDRERQAGEYREFNKDERVAIMASLNIACDPFSGVPYQQKIIKVAQQFFPHRSRGDFK